MRHAVFIAVLLLMPAALFAQTTDPCTADGGIHLGSPACPYQWVGNTSTLYDGSGNGLGFVGMTSQCRAEFGAGARMCRSSEILDSDTLNLNAIPEVGCWVRPTFRPTGRSGEVDESGRTGDAETVLSCVAWSTTGSNVRGLVLRADGSFSGSGTTASCDIPRSVACCAPTPVPAPTSSLPLGVGGLAALAVLRGGV